MSQDDTSQDRDDIREIFTDLDMGILTESEAAELLLASRSKLEALLDKADEKAVEAAQASVCSACDNTGLQKCPDCSGRGYFGYSEWTPEGYCQRCRRTGKLTCKACRAVRYGR